MIVAVFNESNNVVEVLVKAGVALEKKNKNGETALDWARKSENEQIIEILEQGISQR
ncbi:MAG: ankyrin repeat domain-containing protein [Bacteroidales bacterium]|nr:ankyrin repeat domain-containing protein [Bacteroidales bacterium]